MTQPILRVLIQEQLAYGRLPRIQIPRIWGDPRNGEPRDGGEETVTRAQRTHPAMSNGLLRGLTLAAFAALGTMTCVASAGAATEITSCTTLSTFGEPYVLTADLTPDCGTCLDLTENPTPDCGTCLVVANDRITIDLADHTISGSCAGGAGVTDGGTPRRLTTVKNGTITGFEVGVFSARAPATSFAISRSDNASHGLLRPSQLVKDC
jgi:hypothetical protein